MALFKTGTSIGLLNLHVDVDDTSFLSSNYFLLSEFDGNFKLGKNSITINNPPSDLKVEAYDKNSNILYYEKAINPDFIKNTKSIIVSFHVYEQNISGAGKIILVGTFSGKKVRYISNVNVDTSTINSSKVRFYSQPTLEVTPLLTFATKTGTSEQNPKTSSGSFYSKAIFPNAGLNLDENKYNKNLLDYQIISSGNKFSSSFESFYINLNVKNIKNISTGENLEISTTSSILINNVINSNTIQLESPFFYKNPINNKNTIFEIISGSYDILYSDYTYNPLFFSTASYLTESVGVSGVTRYKTYSIAEITYRNLDTFSGTIVRHKIYRRSLNIASDYSVVLDENFNENEILKNYIVPIKSYQNLGNFYAQNFISNFWFTSSNSIRLYHDNTHLIDGMNISGSSILDGYIITKLNTSPSTYRNATYIPYNESEYSNQSGSSYDTNFIKLLKNNDYILSFNCNVLDKNSSDETTLDFYLTGSYENNNKEQNYSSTYGINLARLIISDKISNKNFYKPIQFKFRPLNDLYGTLVIVPRNVNSIVLSSVSIQLDKTTGFSPNSYTVRVPFNVNQPNELFDIKAELYDNNGNLAYSNLRTIEVFDPSGSSSPSSIGGDATLETLKLTNLPILGSGKTQLYISASIVGL